MKNFCNFNFKKTLLSINLILFSATYSQAPSQKMPSVAEVFGGLSEQQIAEQVQMGQKFLEDLEKNGTPEEKAEFERLLIETLNSMSEEDKNDILAISQMVEPLLTLPPQEEPKSIKQEVKTETKTENKNFDTNDIEEFKKLINTLTQRIEDIFQKFNSSKECAEEVDLKWKSKITFNNMKRQIAQLTVDRLAQKLAKRDASEEDKNLVDTLKKFLKDVTQENDALTIEDDFGLPASYALEKKHLKQTKIILSTFDNYIDKLMPMLEKFLRKWDPEALAMSKESEEKTKKALKDSNDAAVRKPSADARPATPTASNQRATRSASGEYPGNYGAYPEYYEQGYNPNSTAKSANSNSPATTPASAQAGSSPSTSTAPKKDAASSVKTADKYDLYKAVINDFEEHMTADFPAEQEEKFVKFMSNYVTDKYPMELNPSAGIVPKNSVPGTPPQALTAATSTSWLDQNLDPYMKDVDAKYKEFISELPPMHNLFSDAKQSLVHMTSNELNKLLSSPEFANLERRLKRYHDTFKASQKVLADKLVERLPLIDPAIHDSYVIKHNDFTQKLQTTYGDDIETALQEINNIKRSAKRIIRNQKAQKTDTAPATPELSNKS